MPKLNMAPMVMKQVQPCSAIFSLPSRHAFYLRNGFRDTNVYRFYGDIEMTILMMGPGTFTIQDWDEITGELRKFWTWN